MTTLEWLQTTLATEYNIDPQSMSADSPLDALGIDSLGVMELFFKVEDTFGVTVPNDQRDLQTVGAVASYIDELIAAQPQSTAIK